MPQRKRPITQRPKVEDESTGNPPIRRGKHQPWDEALPGTGGTKAGLNKYAGVSRRTHAGARHRRPPAVGGGRKENLGRAEGSRRPVRDTGDS